MSGFQHRPLSSSVGYGYVLWLMLGVSVMARAMVRARVRVSVSDGISFNSLGLRSYHGYGQLRIWLGLYFNPNNLLTLTLTSIPDPNI